MGYPYIKMRAVEAKGDLIAGIDEHLADRVPVGNDGEVLTADSEAEMGVSWQPGGGGGGLPSEWVVDDESQVSNAPSAFRLDPTDGDLYFAGATDSGFARMRGGEQPKVVAQAEPGQTDPLLEIHDETGQAFLLVTQEHQYGAPQVQLGSTDRTHRVLIYAQDDGEGFRQGEIEAYAGIDAVHRVGVEATGYVVDETGTNFEASVKVLSTLDGYGDTILLRLTQSAAEFDIQAMPAQTSPTVTVRNDSGAPVFSVGPDGAVMAAGLPTADPDLAGALWSDAGTVKVSGAGSSPRGELGYAERTTADTTSNGTIANATQAGNKMTGLAVTVVGKGRPVEIEFHTPAVWHSTANNYVGVALLMDGVQVAIGQASSPSNASGRSLTVKARKVLTDGQSYTFEVGKYCQTGATGNYHGAADTPMYLSVAER